MPPVKTAAIVVHGRPNLVEDAVSRVRVVAERSGVELVEPDAPADIAIVLGGDGTMLRALQRYLGTSVPVIGVNFGRVGFLTAIPPNELEEGVARVFGGDYTVIELPTLELEVGGHTFPVVNDTVITSATIGRIVELDYTVDGGEPGPLRCDGLIVATPQGSTAYNLSNGGPVLVWGVEAMVLTFVAPHSLAVRPLVIPRGPKLTVTNRSIDVATTVVVDGHAVGSLDPGERAEVRLADRTCLLATLPEVTFFRRYAGTFGH
jgi:NAD+ kinase